VLAGMRIGTVRHPTVLRMAAASSRTEIAQPRRVPIAGRFSFIVSIEITPPPRRIPSVRPQFRLLTRGGDSELLDQTLFHMFRCPVHRSRHLRSTPSFSAPVSEPSLAAAIVPPNQLRETSDETGNRGCQWAAIALGFCALAEAKGCIRHSEVRPSRPARRSRAWPASTVAGGLSEHRAGQALASRSARAAPARSRPRTPT
jgi:hypothetical protein